MVDKPPQFQPQPEEVDTLIAFHAKQIGAGPILVRSFDSDILVLLIGLVVRCYVIVGPWIWT